MICAVSRVEGQNGLFEDGDGEEVVEVEAEGDVEAEAEEYRRGLRILRRGHVRVDVLDEEVEISEEETSESGERGMVETWLTH